MKIFTVYDSKAEASMTPFFQPTTASGIRMFESACNDEGNNFNKYAGDYTLFEIGEFDELTGRIKSNDASVNLGLAITFIQAHQIPSLKEA